MAGTSGAEGAPSAHALPPAQQRQRLAILEARDALRALLLSIEASTSSLEGFRKQVSSQLRDTDAVMRMVARIQQMSSGGRVGGQPHAVAANAHGQGALAPVGGAASATGQHQQIMEHLDAISNFGLASFLTVRRPTRPPPCAPCARRHAG